MNRAEAADWEAQQERANPAMLAAISWIARKLGRGVARAVLVPVTLYFLVTGATARRASRQYLGRMLGRPPTLLEVARHLWTFGAVVLDRIFLLGGRGALLDVAVDRAPEAQRAAYDSERGSLLFVAHMGSMETMRTGGIGRQMRLKVLLNVRQNAMLMSLFERLNPAVADSILDASEGGPALVMKMKEALDAGWRLGLAADRPRGAERCLPVPFLGAPAPFPVSPWVMAHALQVPVVAGFSLYRGGNRYENHFELFAERVTLPRAGRDAALIEIMSRYAQRLEHYLRQAPYNWFNYYDFWQGR